MKTAMKVFCIASIITVATGCGLLRPSVVNAGYYIDNKTDSKTTVLIGTNNSQANAIHAALGSTASATDGGQDAAEASKTDMRAKSSGLFVNNNVGDRAAEIDATAALEMLKDVQGTSAGQALTTTKGDSSPASGDQNQVPSNTQTDTTTTNIPVAVSKEGAVAKTGEQGGMAETKKAEAPAPQAMTGE